MPIDSLLAAFSAFNQGMREYAVGEGMRDAQNTMEQIKQSGATELQKRQQMQSNADFLAMKLGQLGAPVSQIQEAKSNLAPPAIHNAMDAYVQGTLQNSQEMLGIAQQMQQFQMAPELAKQRQKEELENQRIDKQIAAQIQIAKIHAKSGMDIAELKAELAAQKQGQGKPITTVEVNKIQDFETTLSDGADMLQQVMSDPSLTGFGAEQLSDWRVRGFIDPKLGAFDTQWRDWVGKYQLQMTGQGASDSERARILTAVPRLSDPPETFKAKMDNYLRIGNDQRNRYLKNLQRAGRDVSNFEAAPGNTLPLNSSTAPLANVREKTFRDDQTGEITRAVLDSDGVWRRKE